MKIGKTLQELATSVAQTRELSRDYRVAQGALYMDDAGMLNTTGSTRIQIEPNRLFHSQMAEKLAIPFRYYEKMQKDAPILLKDNVNEWLRKDSGDKRLLRTLSTGSEHEVEENRGPRLVGRAFLGNGYKPLDNFDMMEALLPPLMGSGLRVASSEVTETKLYLQLATEKISGRVGDPKLNDIVQLGLAVSNSEVGAGALSIQVLIYRLKCLNGLILPEDCALPGFRKVHVGGGLLKDDSSFRDETRRLTDAAIWAQARDMITAAVNQTTLDTVLDRLNGIAAVKLDNPEKAVELVSKKFDLAESESNGVMRNLIAGGDVSQWGLLNAVTALAHDCPNYDRTVEIEAIGGKIAGLAPAALGNN